MGKEIFVPIERLKDGGKIERDMNRIIIPCDAGEVSDGYHTFNELYEHRYLLFCAMAKRMRSITWTWKCRQHWIDGKIEPVWNGWFLAGILLDYDECEKMITYHLPLEYWDLFDGHEEETPPRHDGHTSQDVIERLKQWLSA
jgi:hypothetical protein